MSTEDPRVLRLHYDIPWPVWLFGSNASIPSITIMWSSFLQHLQFTFVQSRVIL